MEFCLAFLAEHDDDAGSIESGVVAITGGRGERGENLNAFSSSFSGSDSVLDSARRHEGNTKTRNHFMDAPGCDDRAFQNEIRAFVSPS
jgi:hypothetical protein